MGLLDAIEKIRAWRAKLTPEQLQVEDILGGNPLQNEWLAYCEYRARMIAKGKKETPMKAFAVWHGAVMCAYPDEGMTIEMTDEGCRLGNGHVYRYPNADPLQGN